MKTKLILIPSNMNVTIRFKIDKATLKNAITGLLMTGSLRVNKRNIINTIKNEVRQKGISVIDFPEYWGDSLSDFYKENTRKIDMFVRKYNHLINT